MFRVGPMLIMPSLPHKVKTQFRSHAEYFLLPWKIPKEIRRPIDALP